MFYITGDIHGDVERVVEFSKNNNLTDKDTIIILGDAGLNFYCNKTDNKSKRVLNKLGPKIFCIHGNHEIRPETIKTYNITEYCDGRVYVETQYPNILFAIDGEIYNFDGNQALVCGGAYSVDKWYRIYHTIERHSDKIPKELYSDRMLCLAHSYIFGVSVPNKGELLNWMTEVYNSLPNGVKFWWDNEQPSELTKQHVENQLEKNNWTVDVVLTHTCPFDFEPIDMFISGIDQDSVDDSTEKWLQEIERKLNYKHWYAGHFHIDRKVNDKFALMFNDFVKLKEVQ